MALLCSRCASASMFLTSCMVLCRSLARACCVGDALGHVGWLGKGGEAEQAVYIFNGTEADKL